MSTAGKSTVEDAEKGVKMKSDSPGILWIDPCRKFSDGTE
jgi:hypothetical protein